jgi:hypothetical protein
MVSPLEAALLAAVVALPFYLLVRWELGRLADPAYLRAHGVAIRSEKAIERRGTVIGSYCGREIYSEVGFMGMVYRFDRVAPRSYCDRVGARELFLEPGLVYLTD